MSTAISQVHAVKAVEALAKYHATLSDSQLINDDGSVHLTIVLREIPRPKPGKHRFVQLSHPYRSPAGSKNGPRICIFTKDPQSEIKLDLASRSVQVSKVLGISKLRLKYSTYELRRSLASEFDVFLADDRIVPMLPHALGKQFFNSPRKIPIPVSIAKLTPAKLDLALQQAHYKVPSGTLTKIYVGQVSTMSAPEIVANAMDAVSGFIAALPKRCQGFQSIQSLAFALPGVPMLCFYNQLPKFASAQQVADFEKSKKKNKDVFTQAKRLKAWGDIVKDTEIVEPTSTLEEEEVNL